MASRRHAWACLSCILPTTIWPANKSKQLVGSQGQMSALFSAVSALLFFLLLWFMFPSAPDQVLNERHRPFPHASLTNCRDLSPISTMGNRRNRRRDHCRNRRFRRAHQPVQEPASPELAIASRSLATANFQTSESRRGSPDHPRPRRFRPSEPASPAFGPTPTPPSVFELQ